MKKNKFSKVFNAKKYCYSKYLAAYYLENELNENDLGIIVSKKIGNSVIRHLYTRRIREIFRLNTIKNENNYDIIIIVKKSILNKTYKEIEEDYLKLINYIK